MKMMRLKRYDDLEKFFLFLVEHLADIVEEEADLQDMIKKVKGAPDMSFLFYDPESKFRVECDFDIANHYLKIDISGLDEEGYPFSDRVNMFFKDDLLLIGRRISNSITSSISL